MVLGISFIKDFIHGQLKHSRIEEVGMRKNKRDLREVILYCKRILSPQFSRTLLFVQLLSLASKCRIEHEAPSQALKS